MTNKNPVREFLELNPDKLRKLIEVTEKRKHLTKATRAQIARAKKALERIEKGSK